MPRRARLAIPGIPWHIIQHGHVVRLVDNHSDACQSLILLVYGRSAFTHGALASFCHRRPTSACYSTWQ